MTVRWKPLLIMSGLFLAVALVGVVAITLSLVPRSAQGILKRARAARQSQRFADSEIYYKQVLQLEAKNAGRPRRNRRHVFRLVAIGTSGETAATPWRTARPLYQRGQVQQVRNSRKTRTAR